MQDNGTGSSNNQRQKAPLLQTKVCKSCVRYDVPDEDVRASIADKTLPAILVRTVYLDKSFAHPMPQQIEITIHG